MTVYAILNEGGSLQKNLIVGLKINGGQAPRAFLLDLPLQSVGGKLSSHGVLLVVFSFCFLVKVAWVYDPSSQG